MIRKSFVTNDIVLNKIVTGTAENREVNGTLLTTADARKLLQRNAFCQIAIPIHSLGKKRCPFALEAEFADRGLASRSVRTIVLWRNRSEGRSMHGKDRKVNAARVQGS
jgi:hypothetical protein